MKTIGLVIGLGLLLPGTIDASDRVAVSPAFHEELAHSWQELAHAWTGVTRDLRDLGLRWRQHFGGRGARDERPLISYMLRHQEKLGLSAEQTRRLEQIRNDFEREAIRNDADLRIAEMDLQAILDSEPVDLAKVETKVREIERLRSDLWLARIRAIEKGKELLSAEQRKTLQDLLSGSRFSRLEPPGPSR